MERVIWADIAYPIDYVPTGARTQRRDWVMESVPLTVMEAAAADMPLVAEAEVGHCHTGSALVRKEFRSFRKGLVEQAFDSLGNAIRPSQLATSPQGPFRAWTNAASRYPFASGLPYVKPGDAPKAPGDLNVRKEVANGRTRAIAYAQTRAARTVIDGENVWVPAKTVCWSLTKYGRRLDLKPVRSGQNGRIFSDLESARRYADWLVRQPSLHSYRNEIKVWGGIVAHAPDLMPTLSPGGLARRDLDEILTMDHGAGFTTLPLPALEAWCDFRRAHQALRSGDDARARDAYAALAAVVAALPALRAGVDEYRLATNRMQVNLPLSIHYHDAYLAGLLPQPEPEEGDDIDAAALGMVG